MVRKMKQLKGQQFAEKRAIAVAWRAVQRINDPERLKAIRDDVLIKFPKEMTAELKKLPEGERRAEVEVQYAKFNNYPHFGDILAKLGISKADLLAKMHDALGEASDGKVKPKRFIGRIFRR